MGEAHHVLTRDKLAEFHHARGPVRYDHDDVDPLQSKLQYPRLNEFEFDQSLADLRLPNSYETHVPGDTTVTVHIEAQNNIYHIWSQGLTVSYYNLEIRSQIFKKFHVFI